MCSNGDERRIGQTEPPRGIFPQGTIYTEVGLACLMDCGDATVKARVIYGENDDTTEGVASMPIGNHFFIRQAALDAWIEKYEKPQKRPRKRGGARKRSKK